MAHIYVGNPTKVDPEILAAVKTLPNNFFAFAEFDIERNIDWLIVHLNPAHPTGLVVTEVKRTNRRLRGDVNGPWEESVDGLHWTPMLSSGREVNPYQQVTAAANTLKEWLWVHQRFFLAHEEALPQQAFKVWPDLLILGPEGVRPILPLRPPSRFGFWFHAIEPWLGHLRGWRGQPGAVTFTEASVRRIAAHLRLQHIWPEEGAESPQPEDGLDQADVSALVVRVRELEDRVARLEARLVRPEPRMMAPAAPRWRPLAESFPPKPLDDTERAALVQAVTAARVAGRSRAVPAIVAHLDRLLGYSLKDTAYNGRGTATALMEQARAEGLVVFGPKSGPNVTLYLPDEEVPDA